MAVVVPQPEEALSAEDYAGLVQLILPVRNDAPKQLMTVRLDDRSYRLRIRYIPRALGWYMNISTIDDEALISGVRLVSIYDLLGRYQNKSLPPGVLFTFNTVDENADPTRDSMGLESLVAYLPSGQV